MTISPALIITKSPTTKSFSKISKVSPFLITIKFFYLSKLFAYVEFYTHLLKKPKSTLIVVMITIGKPCVNPSDLLLLIIIFN